ncbi:glutaredoxin 2 [Frigidibacter sp. MR17.14]|uniref:glutaredoxin 2 n=1 Tax=Frigidibacter sp. MR17.14 TaxID=3126509 RepID=UPI003012F348
MKLYQYHHCPFCVRADMAANWLRVPHEKVYLLNDDEKTCFELIGAKMVPILQLDATAEGPGRAMGESLDIVAELGRHAPGGRAIAPWAEVKAQQAGLSAVQGAISALLFPRNVRIGLPEFATPAAVAYFTERKSAILGTSFDEAFAASDRHRATVEAALAALPVPQMPGETLRMGDVLLFPGLRNLTVVAGLDRPQWVVDYVAQVAEMTGVQTYEDRAL